MAMAVAMATATSDPRKPNLNGLWRPDLTIGSDPLPPGDRGSLPGGLAGWPAVSTKVLLMACFY